MTLPDVQAIVGLPATERDAISVRLSYSEGERSTSTRKRTVIEQSKLWRFMFAHRVLCKHPWGEDDTARPTQQRAGSSGSHAPVAL
eukprot:5457657-Alexandrium_andersonii.AAC.1